MSWNIGRSCGEIRFSFNVDVLTRLLNECLVKGIDVLKELSSHTQLLVGITIFSAESRYTSVYVHRSFPTLQ